MEATAATARALDALLARISWSMVSLYVRRSLCLVGGATRELSLRDFTDSLRYWMTL
jgi:hypothetical protein